MVSKTKLPESWEYLLFLTVGIADKENYTQKCPGNCP
jgi:hypothetical protein